jgi:quercetin dioxygenase-like cupin family protein
MKDPDFKFKPTGGPLVMAPDGSADGVKVQHYIAGGVYVKQAQIAAGRSLGGHSHKFEHLSILASGIVRVTTHASEAVHVGPTGITIKANVPHTIEAMTNALWYCVHAVPADLDLTNVDASLVHGAP